MAEELGARPRGMGGAYGAVANDANAVDYNPAGLTQILRSNATLTHWIELDGTTLDFISYVLPLGAMGTVAGSATLRQVPSISNTTAEPSVNVDDILVGLSGATKLENWWPGLSGGMSLKFVSSTLGNYTAYTGALDAGVLLEDLPYHSKAALAMENLGMPIKYIDVADPLPFCLRLAGCSQIFEDSVKELLVAADLVQPINGYANLDIGAEFIYLGFVAFRGGYTLDFQEGTRGLVGGLGIKYVWDKTDYRLDYAYNPFYWKNSYTPTHLISLSVFF